MKRLILGVILAVIVLVGGIVCYRYHEDAATSTASVAIPLVEIKTTTPIDWPPFGQYPQNVVISDAEQKFVDQISAFGGAEQVWIGPKGWTGNAGEGQDGNVDVDLYPAGGSASSGPHIVYTQIPACYGCMLYAAASFFPAAMKEYKDSYSPDIPSIPEGLTVTQLSPTLVQYSLPDQDNLLTRGIAFYGTGNEKYTYFVGATVVLPSDQGELANFLLKDFIQRQNLK